MEKKVGLRRKKLPVKPTTSPRCRCGKLSMHTVVGTRNRNAVPKPATK